MAYEMVLVAAWLIGRKARAPGQVGWKSYTDDLGLLLGVASRWGSCTRALRLARSDKNSNSNKTGRILLHHSSHHSTLAKPPSFFYPLLISHVNPDKLI